MILKKVAVLLSLALAITLNLDGQQPAPTSGDVTVRLSEPIDFATARPLQAVRSVVVSSTNAAVASGSMAVLQVQNRDGSFTLKLLRLAAPGQILKTMSQPGVSVGGPPASGPHASLPNGALVRFTLTQQDGSPGAPIQQTARSAATSTQPTATPASPVSGGGGGSTKDRAHFEIEGVKMGMTLADLMTVAKPYGTPKTSHNQGDIIITFKTKDVSFDGVFIKSGVVNRIDFTAISKTKADFDATSPESNGKASPTLQRAIKAYGKPDSVVPDDSESWNAPDGSKAAYYFDGDSVEILAKQ